MLVRADLNVPLEDGRVADDTRIRAALPTLELLLERGVARIRVCSHLGRPKGEDPAFRIAPVAEHLRSLLPDERIEVLENTRFDPGETENDEGFARELAEGCDLYVNDAFGSAHRAHSSTEAVAHLLPAYAGLLLERELEMLGRLLGEVERPYIAIVGGLKVEDKLGVLENLAEYVDTMLIGGKMAEQLREDNPLEAPVRLPGRRRRRGRVRGGRREQDRPLERGAGRLARARHRPGDRRALRGEDPLREDGLLERADGRLRVGALRGGHEGGRGGGGGVRRIHGRRRWRLGARDQRARARRADLAGSRPAAAPRSSCSRARSCPAWPRFRRRTGAVLIAGNWKMFKGPRETRAFFERSEPPEGVDVVLCPSYVSLAAAVGGPTRSTPRTSTGSERRLHRRDLAADAARARRRTGRSSAIPSAASIFGETDETVARRARAALEAGLGVIACVGETLEQRESGDTELVLKIQVEAIAFAAGEHEQLVLAYEPVWAIGTGQTATPEQAEEAHRFIKGLLDRPVLYGGSVKPENAAELLAQPASTARSSAAPRSSPTRSPRFAGPLPSRNARHPRRLGLRVRRPGERGRARRHARLRPALARRTRTRRSRRPARRSACRPARWATRRSGT